MHLKIILSTNGQAGKRNGLPHLSVENDCTIVAVLSPSIQHVFATGLGSWIKQFILYSYRIVWWEVGGYRSLG